MDRLASREAGVSDGPQAPPDRPRLRDRQGPPGLHRLYRRVECRPHLRNARRSRQSALVLVDDRQRSDDARGSRGDPGGSQGTISEKLGRMEGVGEAGGNRVTRLEQRGAVAFAGMAVAVVVILLITIWGW